MCTPILESVQSQKSFAYQSQEQTFQCSHKSKFSNILEIEIKEPFMPLLDHLLSTLKLAINLKKIISLLFCSATLEITSIEVQSYSKKTSATMFSLAII